MAVSVTKLSDATAPKMPDRPIVVRRISFVAEPPEGSRARREFAHPRRMVAVEVAADPLEPSRPKSAELAGPLDVVVIPSGSGSDPSSLPRAKAWLAQSDQPGTGSPISAEFKGGATVDWRPGRAIIRGPAADVDELLAALIDFAFFEAELRALEEIVESREPQASEDVGRAYRVSRSDRAHWPRIGETIEQLAQARLTFARLEPMFTRASNSLSPVGRRLMSQLSAQSDAEARLEALTDRLEALEDLYEGANDRIADLRGWHDGHVLEVIIIILLILEILLMSGDMYFNHLQFQR
jgi:hypothetical protein